MGFGRGRATSTVRPGGRGIGEAPRALRTSSVRHARVTLSTIPATKKGGGVCSSSPRAACWCRGARSDQGSEVLDYLVEHWRADDNDG